MQIPLDLLPVPALVLDECDLHLRGANTAARALAHPFWQALTGSGRGVSALPDGPERSRFIAACERAIARNRPRTLYAFTLDAGAVRTAAQTWWEVALTPLPPATTGDEATPCLLVAPTDVTARHLMHERVEAHVRRDMRLVEAVQRRAGEAAMFAEIGQLITGSLDLPTVLQRVLASLGRVVRYDRASVAVLEPGGAWLRVVSDTDIERGQTGQRVPVAGGLRGHVLTSARPLHIAHTTHETLPVPARLPLAQYPASLVIVPLIAADRPIGTLSVLSDIPGKLTAEDARRVMGIAPQVAVAVANAQLYAEGQERLDELRLLTADLAEANRHKGVFLATMSHELRTPLNAIIGFAELLADGLIEEPEERQQSLDDILRGGRHLLTLVNAVLDLVGVESGQLTLTPRPLNVADTLASTMRVMASALAARQQTFTVRIPADLPPVYADGERTRQVVFNLLTNAAKFTPNGGDIALSAAVNAAGEVEIRVADTGIGIAPEDAGRVWREFRQLDDAISRRYEGTGLGLTLARQFVLLMGGRIWFTSTPGRGSTFFVALPAARPTAEATHHSPTLTTATTAATATDGGM